MRTPLSIRPLRALTAGVRALSLGTTALARARLNRAVAHEQPVLSIDVTDTAGTCTVVLAGEIDLSNSTQLSRELELIVSRPHPPAVIRIDLRDVTFMDSIGLAILLRARRDAELLRSRLTVCAVSPVIARLFEMSGLTGVLTEESA